MAVIPIDRGIMSLSGLGVSFIPSTIFLMGFSVFLAMNDAGMIPHWLLALFCSRCCFADVSDECLLSPARFRCSTRSLSTQPTIETSSVKFTSVLAQVSPYRLFLSNTLRILWRNWFIWFTKIYLFLSVILITTILCTNFLCSLTQFHNFVKLFICCGLSTCLINECEWMNEWIIVQTQGRC